MDKKLTLEQRITRLEKLIGMKCEKANSVADYADADFVQANTYIDEAIQNGDVAALNKYARVGRGDMYVHLIVKSLINYDADLPTTKAACKIMIPVLKANRDAQKLWPDILKLLNKSDNEYLIDFLVKHGFADDIVGRGRVISPLIRQILEDNGISYAEVRGRMRKELQGYRFTV